MALLIFSCINREWDNPYDPFCPKGLFTPDNISATLQGNQILVKWTQSNNHISGYKLFQNINDGTWTEIASLTKEKTAWTITNIKGGEKYGYKIIAVAGDNKSNERQTFLTPILGATLTTINVSAITSTTAVSGGNIMSEGSSSVVSRGVCYGTNQNPLISGNKTINGSGSGIFSSTLTGLTPNTLYYLRAYATNSSETTYGNEVSFKTNIAYSLATVTTGSATRITSRNAVLGGEVLSDGNSTVFERGICYNTNQHPTLDNYKVQMGSGTGTFSDTLTGLIPCTTYYARAYAINSQGTAYGVEISFITSTPNNPTGTFIDSRDGKIYKWVQIGNQLWMAENLAYLPSINPPLSISDSIPYYYVYDYQGTSVSEAKATTNYFKFGVLYNWAATLQGTSSSVCPTGWHVPSDSEWTILNDFLGGSDYAGGQMKTIADWTTPNSGGTNSSGFSGLPGGFIGSQIKKSVGINDYGYWWSVTQYSTSYVWIRRLDYNRTKFTRDWGDKKGGYSIRCTKNSN